MTKVDKRHQCKSSKMHIKKSTKLPYQWLKQRKKWVSVKSVYNERGLIGTPKCSMVC